MATPERTAIHTRKAVESIDERIAALADGIDELREQMGRIEAALQDLLKERVIANAAMPSIPTQKSTRQKGAAHDRPEET